MPPRSKRSVAANKKAKPAKTLEKVPLRSKSKNSSTNKKDTQSKVVAEDSGEEEELVEQDLEMSSGEEDEDVSEVESLHSDALDEDEDANGSGKNGKKRKRAQSSPKKVASKKTTNVKAKASPKKGSASPKKKRKSAKASDDEAEESDFELEEGQEIVGVVVQAPKSGRVPPGQISKNTLDFLSQLTKPECNDREWFKLHEPVYRLAETEWKAFVEQFTDALVEVDPQIPHLPPKDVTHRIYRDVRFSNDKTPYKTGFSASFSRSGRKGIFAAYHIAVKTGGESLIAGGSWCPGRNELATIRSNLQRSSRRFRQVISAPDFVALFGPARPHPKGLRQNVFGMEDELKVAPKGVDKSHKDIDLLKCRSFAVVYRFTDKQVLSPEFKMELANVATVMRPFVHCLNDLMTLQDDNSSSEDEGGEEDSGEGADED